MSSLIGNLGYSGFILGGSGGGPSTPQTLQDVITNGSFLTKTNTINGGGFDLNFTNNLDVNIETSVFQVGDYNSTSHKNTYYLSGAGHQFFTNEIERFKINNTGNIFISTLPSTLASGFSVLGRDTVTGVIGLVSVGSGTVTSVAQSFTGGLISVLGSPIISSGTLALTVAGTSGGIPYFSSGTTWASSAALAVNAIVIGGGAGAAPSTTTTGIGVLTALGINIGSAGAFVTFNGALGTPSSGTLTNATGLPISTGVSGLGTGIATWLGTPSWTNFNSAITGTAPYWSLASGGTLTGTNTITAGSNPLIISTSVTTGTGATAGHQIVANSLTTGNANDYSSSSITTGSILKLTSTSTAANAFSLLNVASSGANANSTRTATGISVAVTNTGTTSTNIGIRSVASGATTNYPLITSGGFVGINNLTPNMELSVGGAINLTTQTSDLAKTASLVSHTNGFMYEQGSTNGLIIADNTDRINYMQIRSNSASSPNEITFNQGTGKAGFLYGGGTLDANKIVGDAQHLFEISNNATASQVFRMSTYGSGAVTGQNNMHFVRMGGTVTSPTQTLSGMYFISMGFRGRDNASTNGQSVAAIQVLAAEDFTASAQGTQFNVQLAPIGSISRTDVIRAYGTGVGILQTSPTAKLHIGAGTATAGTAPQKYSSGVLLTTIEAFAKEANANGTYQSTNALNRFADGGKIYGTSTDVSNTGTSETDLVTYTTKASTLAATDESLIFDIAGTFNDITATAQLQFYYGGTNIGNTGALTVSATGGWSARVIIVRSGSTTAKAMVTVTTPGASTAQYTTVTSVTGLTFTNTNIIKCTGTAGGAGGGTGDITMSVAQLNWWGASNN